MKHESGGKDALFDRSAIHRNCSLGGVQADLEIRWANQPILGPIWLQNAVAVRIDVRLEPKQSRSLRNCNLELS